MTKCNTISGISSDGNVDNFRNFRPGTKYIRISFILNYRSKSSSVKTDIKDIIFQEIK